MPRIFSYDINGSGDTLYGPVVLADAQASPASAITLTAAANKMVQIQFSLERNGDVASGFLTITNDGTNASIAVGPYSETAPVGITFSADINAGNVRLLYTSTSTGYSTNLKYYIKNWN